MVIFENVMIKMFNQICTFTNHQDQIAGHYAHLKVYFWVSVTFLFHDTGL